MDIPVRDGKGKVVGWLRDVNEHRKEVRSRSGAVAGWYDPKFGLNGATFDSTGYRIGEGDLRTSFLDFERH